MDKGLISSAILYGFLRYLPEQLKVEIGLDICSNYSCSSTGYVDSEIHYKFREWQPCGTHVFYSSAHSYRLILDWQFSFSIMINAVFSFRCLICTSYIKVCERSLSGYGAGPDAAAAAQFVRAEMLPSGYLIRPCEGGSIIHIVDHLNLQVQF
jgi:hypothetical protein